MVFVKIDNICDYRIFQQKDGQADVVVTGYVEGLAEPEENCFVFASLEREYNGTCLMPYVRANWDGLNFRLWLKRVPAGGPYTLRVFYGEEGDLEGARNGDIRFHLGVGDIWVIAGQSNAVGYGKTPVMDAPEGRVHLLDNAGVWREAVHPMGAFLEVDKTTAGEGFCPGASPFVSFGNTLARELNYPIGMIMTAQGGASLEMWKKGSPLYERMIKRIERVGGKVRGIAWYQGCTDADSRQDSSDYFPRFREMVQDIREAVGDLSLPVLTVQLNKGFFNLSREYCENWAMVKEAQRRAAGELEHVYMTVSHDLALSDFAHNNGVSCSILGQRLAWQALEQVYHRAYCGTAPDIAHIRTEGKRVFMTFSHVYSHLVDTSFVNGKSDFVFEDDSGSIEVQSCMMRGNRCQLELKREPVGELLCSFAPYCLNTGFLPFDRITGIPIASFYRVAAEKEIYQEQ